MRVGNDRDMLTGGTRSGYQVRVDGDPGHPGEPLGREDQRPGVAFLAWYARVHKDVLQLAGPTSAPGPHGQRGVAGAGAGAPARATAPATHPPDRRGPQATGA